MLIDIITIFPEIFPDILHHSILKRAQEKGLVKIVVHDLRDFTEDKHHKVDDVPYGGGPGMVFKPEPLYRAISSASHNDQAVKRIYLTPQGKLFSHKMAKNLAEEQHLVLVCGHYEGIDQRICDLVIDEEISIGDYVLTGGELSALIVVDAVVRLIPGVLGCPESLQCESFTEHLLDHPHYTRPAVFRDREVPEVLLSGHHENIRKWRRKQSLVRTLQRRPDQMEHMVLTDEDRELLEDTSSP